MRANPATRHCGPFLLTRVWRSTKHLALAAFPAVALALPAHAQVPRTLAQLSQQHEICVASVATIRQGTAGGTETHDCRSGTAPGRPAIFQAASLAKPVFAYGVLKFASDGNIDLDLPMSAYLPGGYTHVQNPFDEGAVPITDFVPPDALQAITPRQVLTHSSGLPNWSRGALEFDFPPGTDWQYSGEGYVLLQHVVERLSGAGLERFMRSTVFEPLGMSDSAYVWIDRFEASYASGTSTAGEPLPPHPFNSPLAAATLYTTADDYGRFVTAVLADRTVLEAMSEPVVEIDRDLGFSWGLGWGVWNGQSERFIWHWGDNPGFKAFVIASTGSGDGLVVLTNSDNGLALAADLVDLRLPQAGGAFRFYMLRNGLSRLVCREFGWCL